MGEIRKIDGLEIQQDERYLERVWKASKILIVVMVLALLAAMLGAFGSGPLNSAVAGSQGSSIWVEYQHFPHLQGPGQITVHLGSAAIRNGKARFWVNRDYLRSMELQQVVPAPSSVRVESDRLVYVYDVSGNSSRPSITFFFQAQQSGRVTGRAGIQQGPSVRFDQWVYP